MPKPRTVVPDDLGAVFSVADAKKHGLRRGTLSSARLSAPFHGVRALPNDDAESNDDAVRRLAHAYAPRMRDVDFVSHVSAARIHAAPLPWQADAVLHIATTRPTRATQSRGVVPHSIDERATETMWSDSLRVATPATTWAMLGDTLDVPWLVAVGDYFCRVWRRVGYYRPNAGRKPHATKTSLESALNSMRWRGITRLREALPLIRLDSWSPMESITRYHLVTNGLPEPQLNLDLYDTDHIHLGCWDMLYVAHRVAVEYNGQAHGKQYAKDIERVEKLRALGWIVIQVSSELLKDPATLVRRVRTALISHGWTPDAS